VTDIGAFIHGSQEAVLRRFPIQLGEAILAIALVACGNEHPTAPAAPETPGPVAVDWVNLQRLYDDPLYRRLPLLLDDASVAESLEAAMSSLRAALQGRDLVAMKNAMASIRDLREAYASRPGLDRHEEPQLLALALFETRGMAYVRYDSLQPGDARLTIEDGR
jgi:hypothetical protein